jgi:transposase-like protein
MALALDTEGQKHVLGLWIEQTEGAKFWLKVMNDLKSRGLVEILIAVVDGLKGFPEAIGAVFPETLVQTCIVHLIRNSLAFVSWKDRKGLSTTSNMSVAPRPRSWIWSGWTGLKADGANSIRRSRRCGAGRGNM